MFFSKLDLEKIKNKISLSTEIEKKTKLIRKGKHYWCCCPFHKEKTPSCKIDDDLGSFYCFGCGVKGDIFTIYTDLYNYSFKDAVLDLAKRTGVSLEELNNKNDKERNILKKILLATKDWFVKNLNTTEAEICREYLKSRQLSDSTIEKFNIGYSYNVNSTLVDYLTGLSFEEKYILQSKVAKLDKNNKIKDYFYKRLIFPITDEYSNIIGFGARSLDNTNPKYINSPESFFFQKRYLLYNSAEAKIAARKKNNLLICEGYMDVISLYQNGIKSVVASLGTSLTEDQLNLAWKFSSKPTIMFDGDKAGLSAAYKTSLMSLPLITSKKFLQFITLPTDLDPDSYINNHSIDEFIKILKNPIPLVNFIFNQSSKAFSLKNADDKVIYDKYLDDLVKTIKDKKIRYFYQNEFKTLFFQKIKLKTNQIKIKNKYYSKNKLSLYLIQIQSFIASYINHKTVRKQIKEELINSNLLDSQYVNLLNQISKSNLIDKNEKELIDTLEDEKLLKTLKESLKSKVYKLFPYSSFKFDDQKALIEIKESCVNLNTRLSNLKKINKSLSNFIKDSTQLNWQELQEINKELLNDE